MKRTYWQIRGFDGFKTIFEMKVGIGQFTQDRLEQMLKTLAAKESLSYSEIVGAYAKRRTKIANNLLNIHRDFPTYMSETTPVFTATLVDEQGKRIPKPRLP